LNRQRYYELLISLALAARASLTSVGWVFNAPPTYGVSVTQRFD
jgi:hypothetical protein